MVTVESTDLPVATKLALDRTRLSYERTLMAWVRTATSLITFGFTIYKFFQYMVQNNQAQYADRLVGPRGYALSMIGIGLFCLILATISHRLNMQALRKQYMHVQYSLAAVLALVISILGILSFLAVIFRQ
ncbi:MAG TPA: DUF202 domain-containing protein [Pyrinomonadaceae bacterium]|nr:DUF202 domain-containing protein [Pyrinomonadaceae bacterium]